ncbi:calexcitin-2 [Trichonephila clavipes]|nr:calexcitin-2 [Trichonephila clavipes]
MGQDISKIKENNVPLSEFRKNKLLYEFNTFYDLNKDGVITESDFFMVQEYVCKLNGWEPESEKYEMTQDLFRSIWNSLQTEADEDKDDAVTAEEWVKMWEQLDKTLRAGSSALPEWLTTYLWCRFNIYDRTGDGAIDVEEFAYILENFGIPERQSRQCFVMMTLNDTKPLDFAYFCELAIEYYTSDDPSALGNFITGKLNF